MNCKQNTKFREWLYDQIDDILLDPSIEKKLYDYWFIALNLYDDDGGKDLDITYRTAENIEEHLRNKWYENAIGINEIHMIMKELYGITF